MNHTAHPGTVSGTIRVPGSKSHTIRGLITATIASGTSRLLSPLDSADTRACVAACRALGARIDTDSFADRWEVSGTGGRIRTPDNVIDVGNSGTTLYLAAGVAAAQEGIAVFTGDEQIRSRPAAPLLVSLNDLGARAESTRGDGAAPFIVGGGLSGGHTSIECRTSQYLSSLLLCAPLAGDDVEVSVPLLHEQPYVEMTIDWLSRCGIRVEHDDAWTTFWVPAGQRFRSHETPIPGDYSSATFFLVAAAITGSTVEVTGISRSDTQGDREVIRMLETMGCTARDTETGIELTGAPLSGVELDLNATPDALPALAVAACFAEGETRLANVPQAREKETDRIFVMREQLNALGADVEEIDDGLIIHGSRDLTLSGGTADGYGDHRVVMSLAIAALKASGPIEITTAESVAVTFPRFFELLEGVRHS